jgi:RNA polymerase sigma factor (sigma-70 family)
MSPLPPIVTLLLAASNDVDRARAWQRFVAEYTRLLVHTARSVFATHDEAMDAYAFLLEQLSTHDYRQLRKYAEDGRSKFTTWLVVVARRICLDHYRLRYGRRRDGEDDETQTARDFRRRLQAFVSEDVDTTTVIDTDAPNAEDWVRANELSSALRAALETLTPNDRLIVKLRFEDDMSAQQIANLLGIPSPFHVYRKLNAITTALRTRLLQKGVESASP